MAIKRRWQYQESAQPVRVGIPDSPVSLDRWFTPTEQPRFDKRRQQHTFPSLFFDPNPIPNPPPLVSMDMWFQATAVPVRVRPRMLAGEMQSLAWYPVTAANSTSSRLMMLLGVG